MKFSKLLPVIIPFVFFYSVSANAKCNRYFKPYDKNAITLNSISSVDRTLQGMGTKEVRCQCERWAHASYNSGVGKMLVAFEGLTVYRKHFVQQAHQYQADIRSRKKTSFRGFSDKSNMTTGGSLSKFPIPKLTHQTKGSFEFMVFGLQAFTSGNSRVNKASTCISEWAKVARGRGKNVEVVVTGHSCGGAMATSFVNKNRRKANVKIKGVAIVDSVHCALTKSATKFKSGSIPCVNVFQHNDRNDTQIIRSCKTAKIGSGVNHFSVTGENAFINPMLNWLGGPRKTPLKSFTSGVNSSS